MKWRCPQCGKPHDRNDPPCDNCGHHKFERAVVPQPQAEEDREQFVWACADCGRHHQRNNPPCSRCGGTNFRKKPLDYGDIESPEDTPGYLELVGRQEIAAAGVAVALVAVGVLGFLGVVQIPGITPQPPPSVEDVPGDPAAVGSVDLADVEADVLAGINDRRSGSDLRTVQELDPVATYLAQRLAKDIVEGREPSFDPGAIGRFDTPCDRRPFVGVWGSQTSVEGATAGEIAGAVDLQTNSETPSLTDGSVSNVGIDAHALPDGRLVVAAAYC